MEDLCRIGASCGTLSGQQGESVEESGSNVHVCLPVAIRHVRLMCLLNLNVIGVTALLKVQLQFPLYKNAMLMAPNNV